MNARFNPSNMMEKMSESGMNPMQMCQKMSESVAISAKMAGFATPQIQALFEDWLGQIEKEILAFAQQKETLTTEQIMEHFGVNEESALYFMSQLIRSKHLTCSVRSK